MWLNNHYFNVKYNFYSSFRFILCKLIPRFDSRNIILYIVEFDSVSSNREIDINRDFHRIGAAYALLVELYT